MKTIEFRTAKELKLATRKSFKHPNPKINISDIVSINGYSCFLSPDVSNKKVTVYSADRGEHILLFEPYTVLIK